MAGATAWLRSLLRRPAVLAGLGVAAIGLGTALLVQARLSSSPATVAPRVAVPGAGLGTPVARSALVVTLDAATLAEGPVTLGVDVRDAGGVPISGATIIVSAASLEMLMETVVEVADERAPGRYTANLDLEMAGRWSVTVQVTLTGGATTLFAYLVTLNP